tara:strand:+ start:276 stop:494 length:219 start_codon:yes stop_codon:yes gene_type:complete
VDISFQPAGQAIEICPVSVHGMLWLQTHFESQYWVAISCNQVKLSKENAKELLKDATNAGVQISYHYSLSFT